MISSQYLYFYRILSQLEKEPIKDYPLSFLIPLVKREIQKLDEDAWNEFSSNNERTKFECFVDQSYYLSSIMEKAIMFLLYCIRLDSIDDNFLDMISSITEALFTCKIIPNTYKLYLDMLLDETIVSLLLSSSFDENKRILPVLIRYVCQEDLLSGNYENAAKFLCMLKNRRYSPIFSGYYSIRNVYDTLKFIVTDEKYALFFSPEDIRHIELLGEIDKIATSEYRDYFRRRIIEIEELCPNQKVTIAKAISLIIPELLLDARHRQDCIDIIHLDKP